LREQRKKDKDRNEPDNHIKHFLFCQSVSVAIEESSYGKKKKTPWSHIPEKHGDVPKESMGMSGLLAKEQRKIFSDDEDKKILPALPQSQPIPRTSYD
jgi:hypothetical protein